MIKEISQLQYELPVLRVAFQGLLLFVLVFNRMRIVQPKSRHVVVTFVRQPHRLVLAIWMQHFIQRFAVRCRDHSVRLTVRDEDRCPDLAYVVNRAEQVQGVVLVVGDVPTCQGADDGQERGF
jgi:hypothetical protein